MDVKLLLLSLATLLPSLTYAHTRWFASGEINPVPTTEPIALYLWGAFLAVLGLTVIGITLHQKGLLRLGFLLPHKSHAYERAASTFTMMVGAFFLIAGTHEYLFSPNLTPTSGIPYFLIVLQIGIGLAFLLGILTRIAGIILAGVWLASFWYAGLILTIENIWVFSTALFIIIMGNDYFSLISFSFLRKKMRQYKKYALSLLRVGTGATLLILGFTEKLYAPEFGLNFLSQHHWNFMRELGLPFSDHLFTIAAGSVEVLFGLLFILGIMTRLNALVVAIIFSLPLFILGPIELAGHLPHFAAVIMLLVFGNGGHFLFFRRYQNDEMHLGYRHLS